MQVQDVVVGNGRRAGRTGYERFASAAESGEVVHDNGPGQNQMIISAYEPVEINRRAALRGSGIHERGCVISVVIMDAFLESGGDFSAQDGGLFFRIRGPMYA